MTTTSLTKRGICRTLTPSVASAPPTTKARTLHLVDIENLAGDPLVGVIEGTSQLAAFYKCAGWAPDDIVMVAANPRLACALSFYKLVHCSVRGAHGKDGAERKLIEHAPASWVADRFERIVIGSGDHYFFDYARQLRRRGVEVVIIGRRGGTYEGYARAG
ncbi:MAG TPA: hypothetical protein VGI86_19745, partial [Acidimicrobiia bacterium]